MALPKYPSADSASAADADNQPQREPLRDRFAFLQAGILDRDHPKNKWFMLSVLAAGLAIVILDGTIVSIALPTIIKSLQLTITEAQWVTALYSVIFAAILMSTGGLADRIGRRRTFFIGLVIFLIGSVMAGSSISSSALIISRGIQGVGGAFVLPSTLSSVHTHFHGRDRHLAFGIWGAVMSGTAAVGPLLGGLILKYATWQYIFLINVPIVLFIMLGTGLFVPNSKGEPNPSTWLASTCPVSLATGIAALVFGIIEAPAAGLLVAAEHHPRLWATTRYLALHQRPLLRIGGGCSHHPVPGWEARAKAGKHVILNLTLLKSPPSPGVTHLLRHHRRRPILLAFLLPSTSLNCLQSAT